MTSLVIALVAPLTGDSRFELELCDVDYWGPIVSGSKLFKGYTALTNLCGVAVNDDLLKSWSKGKDLALIEECYLLE